MNGNVKIEAPYVSYFKEMKARIVYCILGLIFSVAVAQYNRLSIIQSMLEPLNSSSSIYIITTPKGYNTGTPNSFEFVYLEITEAFSIQIKAAFLLGLWVSLPAIQVQIQFFVAPALQRREQELLRRILAISYILLGFSVWIMNDLLLPTAWSFFISFGYNQGPVHYIPALAPQFSICIEIFLAIIGTSQLPLIFFFIIHSGIVSRKQLVNGRSWIMILIVVWSLVVTPPDLISQLILVIPIIVIQELAVFYLIVKIF